MYQRLNVKHAWFCLRPSLTFNAALRQHPHRYPPPTRHIIGASLGARQHGMAKPVLFFDVPDMRPPNLILKNWSTGLSTHSFVGSIAVQTCPFPLSCRVAQKPLSPHPHRERPHPRPPHAGQWCLSWPGFAPAHQHSRRAHAQFAKHRSRFAAQSVGRDHRFIRLGQVKPCV